MGSTTTPACVRPSRPAKAPALPFARHVGMMAASHSKSLCVAMITAASNSTRTPSRASARRCNAVRGQGSLVVPAIDADHGLSASLNSKMCLFPASPLLRLLDTSSLFEALRVNGLSSGEVSPVEPVASIGNQAEQLRHARQQLYCTTDNLIRNTHHRCLSEDQIV